ncbi:MAG: hypothetical protein JRN39_04550 [Nitrososphaerota archaeon]|nr:hypothetical protein [Nitrososphaerota archaeon]
MSAGNAYWEPLESYEPGVLVGRLEDELRPYFESISLIVRSFIERNKEDFVKTLPYRIYNEKAVIDFCAQDMLEMGKSLGPDTDVYVFIARQLEDEAKHFMMLKRVYEKLSGRPFSLSSVKPAYAPTKYGRLVQQGEVLRRAANRYAGEGAAYIPAKLTAELVGGEIGRAYNVIEKDEFFHKRLGQLGLESWLTSKESFEKVRETIAERRSASMRMWLDIYGFNKEAVELFEANYGGIE